MKHSAIVLIVLNVLGVCSIANSIDYTSNVELTNGKVRGLIVEAESGHKVRVYHGIRYGRAKRFSKATPEPSWSGVYDATEWRAACPQANLNQSGHLANTQIASEDCLFLSVFTPPNATNSSNLPVMIWIHGGGYAGGTIFSEIFDGVKYLVDLGGVIVVNVNYRLGAFGFLYGGTEDAPGNLGLHDQILAIHWVKDNIRRFGGNPEQMTLFGESAGSMSIGSLLLSPLTSGLFQRVIMQSGGPNVLLSSQSAALEQANKFSKLHCQNSNSTSENLQCLRNISMETLLKTPALFAPIFGDSLLPVNPNEAAKSGKFNRNVSIMYGVNQDEGFSFAIPLLLLAQNLTVESVKMMIAGNVGANGSEIADFYIKHRPHSTQESLKMIISDVFGDQMLVCPQILFTELLAHHKPQDIHYFAYRLTQPLKNIPEFSNPIFSNGVPHGIDQVYLFGLPLLKSDPAAAKLGRDMIRAWTNFAKIGTPGKMDNVEWGRALEHENTRFMQLDSANYTMVDGYFRETCNAIWASKMSL